MTACHFQPQWKKTCSVDRQQQSLAAVKYSNERMLELRFIDAASHVGKSNTSWSGHHLSAELSSLMTLTLSVGTSHSGRQTPSAGLKMVGRSESFVGIAVLLTMAIWL